MSKETFEQPNGGKRDIRSLERGPVYEYARALRRLLEAKANEIYGTRRGLDKMLLVTHNREEDNIEILGSNIHSRKVIASITFIPEKEQGRMRIEVATAVDGVIAKEFFLKSSEIPEPQELIDEMWDSFTLAVHNYYRHNYLVDEEHCPHCDKNKDKKQPSN